MAVYFDYLTSGESFGEDNVKANLDILVKNKLRENNSLKCSGEKKNNIGKQDVNEKQDINKKQDVSKKKNTKTKKNQTGGGSIKTLKRIYCKLAKMKTCKKR